MRLHRDSPELSIVLRMHYCMRGTLEEKAVIAGEALGEPMSRNTFRRHLEQAKWWMRGAINAR